MARMRTVKKGLIEMRKVFLLLSAIVFIASINLVPNPSLAIQKNVNDVATTTTKTNKSHGHKSDMPSSKPGIPPVEKGTPGDKSGASASSGGNGNSSSKKPATKLSSPKKITFSNVAANSFRVHWQSVDNSFDYQIRVYGANGHATVFDDNVGGTHTVFMVNRGVNLSQNTYRVSVQALAGNNSDYADSPESGKFEVSIPVCGNDGLIVGTTNICQVGNTGPGGGVIFYYSAAGFNCGVVLLSRCKFLEVAPQFWSTLNLDGHDPAMRWSNSYRYADISAIPNLGRNQINDSLFGLGRFYTAQIITQNGLYDPLNNKYAAGAANAYRGGTKDDWYLPDLAESNQLCLFVNAQTSLICQPTGVNSLLGFLNGRSVYVSTDFTGYYWTSSEGITQAGPLTPAWAQYFDGGRNPGYKGQNGWVRPIRSF